MRKPKPPEQTGVIPGMLGGSPYAPRAALLQRRTGTPDEALTALARGRGHNVMWWWGIRKVEGDMSAYCYVCDGVIVRGALNTGITEAQSDAIENHRMGHWQDTQQAPAR